MIKAYLGDSVYVDVGHFDGEMKLTTENGYGPTNQIYLDAEVFESLMRWVAAWRHEREEEEEEKLTTGGLPPSDGDEGGQYGDSR